MRIAGSPSLAPLQLQPFGGKLRSAGVIDPYRHTVVTRRIYGRRQGLHT
jgi:hypothetical protein